MLIAIYRFLNKLCPHLNQDELDVVISVDKEGKPEIEVKYFDYASNDWEELTSIVEYQRYPVEEDKQMEIPFDEDGKTPQIRIVSNLEPEDEDK